MILEQRSHGSILGDESFLLEGSQTVLHVKSLGRVLYFFVNIQLEGSAIGNANTADVSKEIPITLKPGKNKLDLFSVMVGLKVKQKEKALGPHTGDSFSYKGHMVSKMPRELRETITHCTTTPIMVETKWERTGVV
ncbi:hypothetical protein L6452_05688 [Arctium lappa]|uniref:Uncharacterized protein n=1 Tax=Arctium lappa TaxID=4217 RepID=A0ACB9EH29_ARCLA|nr:hypothetical protein L6452_05688 [Arctium lappa]